MYEKLIEITRRPDPYACCTTEILWNDRHISKQMLAMHLDPTVDLASRNKAFNDRAVDWMSSRFHVGTGTRVCDFGCGPGLYTSLFAQRGARVTGVDFSERSIRHARKAAAQNGLDINYVLQNYLDFTTDERFDLMTMIYCDFCPLSPAQRKAMIQKFYEYLDDDGAVVLDVCSLSAYEKREEGVTFEHLLLDGFWSAEDYFGYMVTFKYDADKLVLDRYTIVEKDRMWEVHNWMQHYSLASLEKEFEDNGFRIVAHYSDVAGTPYQPDAPEIAIVAKKMT